MGILAAIAIYALLPGEFNNVLRYVLAALMVAMVIPLIALNPSRLTTQNRWSRSLALALVFVLLAANQIALVQLVIELVSATGRQGPLILLAAVQVWAVNVVAFSVVYWELDRGGPFARRREHRDDQQSPDFLFPQDAQPTSHWRPSYFDYLYFSFTDAMAFSATDVMPLRHRAKLLMLIESLAGFVILALVIARSVNILSG